MTAATRALVVNRSHQLRRRTFFHCLMMLLCRSTSPTRATSGEHSGLMTDGAASMWKRSCSKSSVMQETDVSQRSGPSKAQGGRETLLALGYTSLVSTLERSCVRTHSHELARVALTSLSQRRLPRSRCNPVGPPPQLRRLLAPAPVTSFPLHAQQPPRSAPVLLLQGSA